VELLEGNVGYVDFRQFADAGDGGATAIAALNFLAYADAIIFDMRRNGGGHPSMIQLISSHFFDTLVHLNSFYIRKDDTTQQFWTQAWVPGPDLTDADLYVLTSKYTFSGAEEFTYNLKNLKRATIIGETTGGGAHPVQMRLFENLNVGMSLPFGRAINPISGTNWEGTGITPDIEVPQEEALDVAHLRALKTIAEKADDPGRLEQLNWAIEGKQAKLKPFEIDPATLKKYVGSYGPRKITLEGDVLYYQRADNPHYKLIPMSEDTFMLKELGGRSDEHERDK
jgi:C-terminal processing protease CtpA/Prc